MKNFLKLFYSATTLLIMASLFSAFVGTPLLATAGSMVLVAGATNYALIQGGVTSPGLAFLYVFDPSGITFHGKEAASFAESIFDKEFKSTRVDQIHTLVEGIVTDQAIPYYGRLGLVGRTHDMDNCAPTLSTEGITARQKKWEPKTASDRFFECWTSFVPNANVYALKRGIDAGDISELDAINYLKQEVANGIQKAMLRFGWFSDTAAATVSGGGVFKNGTNVDYFNLHEGLWKQIFAIVTADANRLTAITKNAGASYALQAFDAADTTNEVVTNIFQDMIDGADERLSDTDTPLLLATKSMCVQFKKERKAITGIDLPYMRVEKGFNTLEIDGTTIVEVSDWDRIIKTYQNNGTKWNNPHRALLTTKENIPLGFDTSAVNNMWKSWYEQKDNGIYIDSMWKQDAKVILDYMVQAAY